MKEIYIVFEYAEHTNKIIGCYQKEEDAKAEQAKNSTFRYIQKEILC